MSNFFENVYIMFAKAREAFYDDSRVLFIVKINKFFNYIKIYKNYIN